MKRVWVLLGVFAAVGIGFEAAGLLADKEHYGGFWNGVPLWDLGFGAVGGAVLALVAKGLLKPRIARSEDDFDARSER